MLVWVHWNKEVENRLDELAWARRNKEVENRLDRLALARRNKEVENRLDRLAEVCLSQMVFDMLTEAWVRKQDEVYSLRSLAQRFSLFEREEEHVPFVHRCEKAFLVAEYVSQEFQLQWALQKELVL